MELRLNIYEGRKVVKTYTANEFDLMFGTVEDLVNLIEVEKFEKDASDMDVIRAVAQILTGGIGKVKDLLLEIFPDATEEELRNTRIREVANVLVSALKYGFSNMAAVGSKN